MATISFNEFSKGGPVSVVGNEGNILKKESESGPSFMQGLSRVASVYGKNLKEQALGGVETAQKTFGMGVDTMQQAQQMPMGTRQEKERASGLASAGAAQIGVGAMSGTIQTAFSPLTAALLTGVQGYKELDQATGGKIQNQLTTLAQAHPELIKGYSDMVTQNPKTAQFVMDSINVLTAGLGGKPALEAAQGATRGLVTGAKETVSKVPTPSVPPGVSGMVEKVLPTSESIMQRVARIPKGEQAKFERLTGKSVGQFLDETGNYGTPDKIVERLYNDFTQSKATADKALAQIPGTYKSEPVTTALKELEGKVQRTSSPGAPDADLARVTELVSKAKTQGLTMTEINEVKRIYERRVRLDYLKSNIPEDVTRANNVDNALREWQFKEAEKAGFTNLPEINKFTQANKQLMDALGKEISGSAGNNALGLTDAILVAGGSPESIASLVTKKIFSDKGVQSYIAKKISKTPVKTEVPKAKFKNETQAQPQSQEKVLQSQPNTTPTPPKGKGIRGMIDFDEIMKSLIPTKKLVKEAKDAVDELEATLSYVDSTKSPQAVKDLRKELGDLMTSMGRETVITNSNYRTVLQEADDMLNQLKAHIKNSEAQASNDVIERRFIKNPITGKLEGSSKKKVVSEVEAIKQYTKDGGQKINTAIRSGKTLDENIINGIDAYINGGTKYKGTSYRGLTLSDSEYENFIKNLKKNGYTDKGYISSSENFGDSTSFARTSPSNKTKGVILEIESNNGTIIDKKLNKFNEEEILHPRNSNFEYVDEYARDGKKVIVLKEKAVSSLEQEAKGKIVSSQNEWVKDTFWGKSIRNDAIETTIPISEIGDGKLIGIRQANVTDNGVKEWVARIKKGERPTVLIGNKKSGDKGIVVLDGNHRLEAYRQLGIKEIPIVDNTGGKLKK